MTGICSRQKGQSELMCVSGPFSKKLHALFADESTMVFLFKSCTSESLSELRKRQRGRGKHVLTKATGSGYLTCKALLSSEQPGVWAAVDVSL